jgi:hypothetical protein
VVALAAAFDELAWGMSERSVRARYPKAKAGIAGIVVVMQDKIGKAKLPILVRFFVEDGLAQITAVVHRFYGQASTEEIERDLGVVRAWVAKRTGMVTTTGNEWRTEHAKIQVDYDDEMLGAYWTPIVPKPPKPPKPPAKKPKPPTKKPKPARTKR